MKGQGVPVRLLKQGGVVSMADMLEQTDTLNDP